jgi:iron complex outermembrane receptor protein
LTRGHQPLLALALLVTCLAQPVSPVTAGEQSELQLEEVIVMARRRESSILEAPLSVTAFSAPQLEQIRFDTVADIAPRTPNLSVAESLFGNATPLISIRGITNLDISNFAKDYPVGYYVDGVVVGRASGSLFDLFEVERIEVLRGPQGTLYGRNTTGGAISVITRKPTGQWGFKQELSVGNRDLFQSKTHLDLPAFSGISLKGSYVHSQVDGAVDNRYRGAASNAHGPDQPGRQVQTTLGGHETQAWRVALRWEPSDNVLLDYAFERNRYEGTAIPLQLVASNPDGPFAWALTNRGSQSRQDSLELNNAESNRSEVDGHKLSLSWDWPALTIKSITGYRTLDQLGAKDLDGGNHRVPFLESGQTPQEHEQFSQEIQFLGSGFEGAVDYVAGLYYFEEEGTSHNDAIATLFFFPDVLDIDNRSMAFYGETTFPVAAVDDRLSFTLGLRYTLDERAADIDRVLIPESSSYTGSGEEDWSNFDWSATANYRVEDRIHTYFRVATAYKSGGFNARADSAERFANTFDPEDVITFETGVKAEWFKRRFRTNVAVFYTEYEDLQVDQQEIGIGSFNLVTANAGAAQTWGTEIEMIAVAMPGLTLSLGYGYFDSNFDEYRAIFENNQDFSDVAVFPLAAEHSLSLTAQYELPRLPIGQASLYGSYTYSDEQAFGDLPGGAGAAGLFNGSDSYHLFNARLTLASIPGIALGELRLALWGKNLGDEEYKVYGSDLLKNLGIMTASFAPTRSYGLDLVFEY